MSMYVFKSSSTVEHTAVNGKVGSSNLLSQKMNKRSDALASTEKVITSSLKEK